MSCYFCEKKAEERGFRLSGNQYTCRICRQRWWCYNEYYHHWTPVDDDFTWDVITHNVDFPINISNPAVVLPGYEKYAVKPVHEICEERVFCPKLTTMDGPGGDPRPAIQWIGEWKPGNVFKHQFLFPLESRLPKQDWLEKEKLDTFQVPFVGTKSYFPYRDQMGAFPEDSGEKAFAFLISDRLKMKGRQASFIVPLVFLGDPNLGVIKAGYFFEDFYRYTAVVKFQKQ